jgi:Restriction endonuclease AspBHI N-terminal/Restriction endonuclease
MDRQALPSKDVDDVQRAKGVAVLEAIVDEVHAPALIGLGRQRRNDAQVGRALLPLLGADAEPFFAVQRVDAFVIHRPALALEKHRQPPIPVAPARLGQFTQTLALCTGVVIDPTAVVPVPQSLTIPRVLSWLGRSPAQAPPVPEVAAADQTGDNARMRIGERLRYGQIDTFPASLPKVAGMTNWWHETRAPPASPLKALKLDAGINSPAPLQGPHARVSVVCLRSSTHKVGSDITPWEDIHRPDLGYSRYFGDNKVKSGKAAHETLGNSRLLETFALHGGDEQSRLRAPPVLVFEAREKGQIVFHGVGVLTRAELVVQRDPASGGTFTNYRYDVILLDLAIEDETLDWAWINARRDATVSARESLRLAPKAWKEWVRYGSSALERLQRQVLTRNVVDDEAQLPVAGSEEARVLQVVYDFYAGRKHRFEVVADFVTAEILRAQRISYQAGWITKGSGDGGLDFVGRVDLDPDGGFPSSRQVLLGQAKCEALTRPTGGNHIARLAARLRRGWFGSYVTTSFFSAPVQKEVLVDKYPLLMVHGGRVAATLRQHMVTNGLTIDALLTSLNETYPGRLGAGDPEQVLL